MKLSQLSAKPQLIKMVIDDQATIEEFGEAIEFYTWDRQPIDLFLKMASIDSKNQSEMITAVKDLVMDENGVKIIDGGSTIPTKILMKVITKVVESLGKF
jgi:hypothetical protein